MINITDITISYKNCDGLKKTLDSLFKQRLEEISLQIIVIDGESNDGSKELLERYEERFSMGEYNSLISFIYVSEPDSGIYNAMNKGIDMAQGDWVMFLNSGDTLSCTSTLVDFWKYISKRVEEYGTIDVVYGDSERLYDTNNYVTVPSPISSMVRGLPFSHQSCFTKMELFKNRHYDEKYRIAGDYEWFLNAYIAGRVFKYVPICVSRFDTKGISATRLYDNWVEVDSIREIYGMAGKNLDRFIKRICWFLLDKIKAKPEKIEKINMILADRMCDRNLSFVIPIYKGKKYIDGLVRMAISNVDQSVSNTHVELVFVNDYPNESIECEIDEACNVIRAVEKKWIGKAKSLTITLVNNESNQGIHRSRVNGVKKASHSYVTFLDQDDYIEDRYVMSQFEKIKDADIIVANGIEERRNYRKYLYRFRFMQRTVKSLYFQSRYGCRIISPGQCVIKKSSIPEAWMETSLDNNGADDYMLWLLMLEQKLCFAINRDVIYTHLYTGNNVSLDNRLIKKSREEVVSKIGNKIGKTYSKMILNYKDDSRISTFRAFVERINRV